MPNILESVGLCDIYDNGDVHCAGPIPSDAYKPYDAVYEHYMTGFNRLIVAASVTVLPEYYLEWLPPVDEVIIENGVAEIKHGAFYNTGINHIYIPSSVRKIEAWGIPSIGDCIYYEGAEEQWNAIDIDVDDGNEGEGLLDVPRYYNQTIPADPYYVENNTSGNTSSDTGSDVIVMSEDSLARQYHSITIGQYNTWKNWRLIPTSRPVVNPPEVKTNFVEVPGADGVLDFTEALDEKIHYKPREGQWEFLICHERIDIDTNHKYHSENRWATLWHDILNAVHGKRNQIILMDEWPEGGSDNRFYVGRVWLNGFISDPSHSRIVFDYNLEPFRYLTTEDAQNRVNGVL